MEHTVYYKKGKKKIVLAGIITTLAPMTGFGSLVAIFGIKDLKKNYEALEKISTIDDSPETTEADD